MASRGLAARQSMTALSYIQQQIRYHEQIKGKKDLRPLLIDAAANQLLEGKPDKHLRRILSRPSLIVLLSVPTVADDATLGLWSSSSSSSRSFYLQRVESSSLYSLFGFCFRPNCFGVMEISPRGPVRRRYRGDVERLARVGLPRDAVVGPAVRELCDEHEEGPDDNVGQH